MNNGNPKNRLNMIAQIMAALGIVGALLVVLLRVWGDTLIASNLPVIVLMMVLLLALGAMVFIIRGGPRREIVGKPALLLAATMLVGGVVMALHGVAEVLARFEIIPFYSVATSTYGEETTLTVILPWLQTVFSVLGGAAMVLAGLRLASEGSTRRGIVRVGMLLPVLWIWLALANYMMSYSSMVRITNGFFTLAMYIMEMLFLFRFACYLAGIGKTGVGSMLFFSSATVLCTLSAPLVRYLSQESAEVVGAVGPLDLVIGLLALVFCATLCHSLSAPVAETVEEDAPEWTGAEEEEAVPELIEELDEGEDEEA